MTISFSGVGSGTDWSSIISQLVAVEKAPADALTKKKSDASTQLSLVADLVTRLAKLSSAGNAMATTGSLLRFAATSSAAATVQATASGASAPGSYRVHVDQVATAETQASQSFASPSAPGDGSVSIGVGGGTPVAVAYQATDSLADVAARINDEVPGVTASAIYDGATYRLVVTSNTGGSAGALSVSEAGAGLGLAVAQAAQDAQLTVNGVPITRGSNQVADVIPGVTLDLQAAGDATVTVARDSSSIVSKVHGLVDAYNGVAQLVAGQLSYDGTRKGSDTLFGDPIVAQLQTRLGAIVSQGYRHGGDTTSLAALGVSLAADGTLAVDDSKLKGALASDPTLAADLFTGSSGAAGALALLANSYTGSSGALLTREDSLRRLMTSYDQQVKQIDDRADAYQTQLQSQFASLDSLMAAYTTDTSYLSAITSTTTKG